jgi:hypothetical protein
LQTDVTLELHRRVFTLRPVTANSRGSDRHRVLGRCRLPAKVPLLSAMPVELLSHCCQMAHVGGQLPQELDRFS